MIRGIVKKSFRRLGVELVTGHTQIGLQLLVHLQGLRSQRPLFVLQVGAQDGVTGDVVGALVKQEGWSGALIEPRDSMFERLQRAYAGQRGVRLFRCAVSREAGERRLYALDGQDASLPAWAHGLGTFDRDVLLRHEAGIPGLRERIVEEVVQCRTWGDLLDDINPPKVDLLQIDVEGMDAELVQSFPLTRVRPGLIRYEHKHLTAEERVACEEYLVLNGYRPVVEAFDTIAFEIRDETQASRRL